MKPFNIVLAPGVDISHEDPKLLTNFYALATQFASRPFTITSGDRTHQPSNSNFPIAPEGTSLHERYAYGKGMDEAIDVVIDGQPIGGMHGISNGSMQPFDLHVPFFNDPVHLELGEFNG